MPSGATFSPRTGPKVGAILWFARFPEGKIGDTFLVVFVFVAGHGGPVAQFAGVQMGEPAVAGETGEFEIDGAIIRGVGMALGHQRLDHGDLLGKVFDGAGFDVGRSAAEGGAVGMKGVAPFGRESGQRLAGGFRAADGFVIHVRQIAHVARRQSGGFDHATKDVLDDKRAEVSDMSRAIDGRAAAVEAE